MVPRDGVEELLQLFLPRQLLVPKVPETNQQQTTDIPALLFGNFCPTYSWTKPKLEFKLEIRNQNSKSKFELLNQCLPFNLL
jgi:hypothetical protein